MTKTELDALLKELDVEAHATQDAHCLSARAGAALRELEKPAARWQFARQFFDSMEVREWDFRDGMDGVADERESVKVDRACDARMEELALKEPQ